MVKIIGLTGKKGSGKTTVAGMLEEWLAAEYVDLEIRSLATPLKEVLALIEYGPIFKSMPMWTVIKNYDDQKVKMGNVLRTKVTRRKFMQDFGTFLRNTFGEDYLVDEVLTDVPHLDYVIIPDVRYDNEAKKIIEAGGSIIKIDRQTVDDGDIHSSEAGVSAEYVTYTIDNSLHLTLEDLERDVMNAFNMVMSSDV